MTIHPPKRMLSPTPVPQVVFCTLFAVGDILKTTRYRRLPLSALVGSMGKHSPKSPWREAVEQRAASSAPQEGGLGGVPCFQTAALHRRLRTGSRRLAE